MAADALKLLMETDALVKDWEEKRSKILAQFESIGNINTQLDSLKKCEVRGSLGVLSSFSSVCVRLKGKLLLSQERAIAFIDRDQKLMEKIVKDLLHKKREAEKIWRKMAEKDGVDVLSKRSEESFSVSDWLQWIKELSCLVYANWKTMAPITYPLTESMINAWNKELYGVEEITSFIAYTVQESKK
ncbi:PREDICTED: uncharacterized protein LOC109580593 [Amphimedon queenslandica]|uniref:Uncharacterized protein n=1 Tax=Amphimedon queenslandica TaxID=400682 RepID=A0A1X7VDT8_AMPQE|nr:PREDICTED: uncharacterized protein LOC109580593 [Amphimedon queenslandica]|eukprot:XP_019849491.1 PREDICTED: uncharacterized protein LOC109580593 [Amphimedon queenslandica]